MNNPFRSESPEELRCPRPEEIADMLYAPAGNLTVGDIVKTIFQATLRIFEFLRANGYDFGDLDLSKFGL